MQEKDLEISYKILHFYPDLRENFTLLLAKIVHFFPVKVDNFLRNLKVFFLRSENVIRNLKVFFLHRKGKTPINSVCVMSILGKNFHFFPVKGKKVYEIKKTNTFKFRMCGRRGRRRRRRSELKLWGVVADSIEIICRRLKKVKPLSNFL